ncbi:phosphate signaling complex protein PhoU [Sporichthya brevicatena]|uniref:Phosphate-specific transport system accessory protein PhoU n=1 Tax=Sporichthya brevicatena TaxID=171442 RepID=A0ABN1GHH6_9ACTN
MRDAFQGELDHLRNGLVEMTQLVGFAMARATNALLEADLALAESVISHDKAIDQRRDELEEKACDLLVRQQPVVATDLRTVITSLQMTADIERMGDLALHVAKVARMRYPASAVPPEMVALLMEMGHLAQRIVTKAGSVVASRDVSAALELEASDDEMDHLHARMFRTLMSPDWPHGIQTAVDLSQLARFYERYADHAVSVARRVVYLVTGEWPVSTSD